MSGTCEATMNFVGITFPCENPAIGRFRRGCIHEHIRDGRLCGMHASDGTGLCRTCFELDEGGHDCPIVLAEVPAVTR